MTLLQRLFGLGANEPEPTRMVLPKGDSWSFDLDLPGIIGVIFENDEVDTCLSTRDVKEILDQPPAERPAWFTDTIAQELETAFEDMKIGEGVHYYTNPLHAHEPDPNDPVI